MPRPRQNKSKQKKTCDRKPAAVKQLTEVCCPIVGIGASAGGLVAFKKFFNHMPDDSGIAFVLVPHLDPSHQSLMVELLSHHTEMPVCEVNDGQAIEANHVYIIPPAEYLAIENGKLRLSKPPQPNRIETAIDHFLNSLADDQAERAIGVILSGTSSHGSAGLQAIKANGGMVMVQQPETAEYDAMPQNAIATGIVDYILPPEEMPATLIRYVQHACVSGAWQPMEPANTELDALRIQTDRLLRMVDHLPAGAVYRENDHLTINRAAERITGYSREELATPDQWFEKLYGKREQEIRQQYQAERAAGFPRQTGPIALTRKNGEQRFVEFAAYRFDEHEVWIMHDVSKRQESEAALRDREERLRAVMDNAAEAIIVIGTDGLVTDLNNAAEKLFGYAANEIISHNVSMLMPSPYREAHDSYIAHYLQTGEPRVLNQSRELPGRRKDGSTIPLELTITEVEHLGAFVGIIRDLSEQKALERQIADISTEEQERIGQEIHDGLGQQLTGLSMVATSIKRSLASRNQPEAEQLDQLITQLQLSIKEARALAHGLAPVPINPEGLTDALTMLARDVKSTIGIDCSFETHDAIKVKDRTDAVQIYRIAQEAVNNAVKHANATKITIYLGSTDGTFELSISDNGCGFEPDQSTSDSLGIRIMRYRAGIIGCNLAVISTVGKGTVVRCRRAATSST